MHCSNISVLSTAGSEGIVGWTLDHKTAKSAVLDTLSDKIPTDLLNIMGSYVPEKQDGVFGEKDWNELCGRVAPAPPIPQEIEDIWEGPCPIFPDKKVKDTHILVYLPTTVDGKPLTTQTMGEIAKRYFPESAEGYRNAWQPGEMRLDQTVETAGWVLMTKTVIDESRNESYENQQTMITNLAQKTGVSYTIPTALEASICIYTHYMRTGTRLFSDNPLTNTNCQKYKGYRIYVGGLCEESGMIVNSTHHSVVNHIVGVAAIFKPGMQVPVGEQAMDPKK